MTGKVAAGSHVFRWPGYSFRMDYTLDYDLQYSGCVLCLGHGRFVSVRSSLLRRLVFPFPQNPLFQILPHSFQNSFVSHPLFSNHLRTPSFFSIQPFAHSLSKTPRTDIPPPVCLCRRPRQVTGPWSPIPSFPDSFASDSYAPLSRKPFNCHPYRPSSCKPFSCHSYEKTGETPSHWYDQSKFFVNDPFIIPRGPAAPVANDSCAASADFHNAQQLLFIGHLPRYFSAALR
jgi:hypothetical protein